MWEVDLLQYHQGVPDVLVTWRSMNRMHRRKTQCKRGAESNPRQLAAEEEREVTARAFSTYGLPLEMVTSFRYPVWVISAVDDDWPAVVRNLSRVRAVWKRKIKIHSREGGAPRMSNFFFKAVVQVLLLFGLETWVVTPRIGNGP